MLKFTFQLEALLRHRKNIEQQRQRDLAAIQAQMVPLEVQLAALASEVQASNVDMRKNHLTGKIDLGFLAAHRRYLGATQRRATEIAEKMAVVQRKIDQSRRMLIDAARDRQVLEKLRERQQTAWQAETNRKENAALDELATQMSYRKQHT